MILDKNGDVHICFLRGKGRYLDQGNSNFGEYERLFRILVCSIVDVHPYEKAKNRSYNQNKQNKKEPFHGDRDLRPIIQLLKLQDRVKKNCKLKSTCSHTNQNILRNTKLFQSVL
jgi:hypothetical protein